MRVCTARTYHRPTPLTLEEHHIQPQAWQHFWTPKTGKTGRNARQAELVALKMRVGTPEMIDASLFDPRTVTLCPTCHRNVHAWLVKAMRYIGHQPLGLNEYEYMRDAVDAMWPRRKSKEMQIALEGMLRWLQAGGSLKALADAGLVGNA